MAEIIEGEWFYPNEHSGRRRESPVSDSLSRLSGSGRELARVDRQHQVDIAKARNDGRRRALEQGLREVEMARTISSVGRVMSHAEQVAAGDPDKLDALLALGRVHIEIEAKTYRNAHDPDYRQR